MTRIAIIDVASIEELARNGHMRTPLPRELEAIEVCWGFAQAVVRGCCARA
jgi:hypothetical protein